MKKIIALISIAFALTACGETSSTGMSSSVTPPSSQSQKATCAVNIQPFYTEYTLDGDVLSFTSGPEVASFPRVGTGEGVFGEWDLGTSTAPGLTVATHIVIQPNTVTVKGICTKTGGARVTVTASSTATVDDTSIEWFDYDGESVEF